MTRFPFDEQTRESSFALLDDNTHAIWIASISKINAARMVSEGSCCHLDWLSLLGTYCNLWGKATLLPSWYYACSGLFLCEPRTLRRQWRIPSNRCLPCYCVHCITNHKDSRAACPSPRQHASMNPIFAFGPLPTSSLPTAQPRWQQESKKNIGPLPTHSPSLPALHRKYSG